MSLILTITAAGRAALVNAEHTGTAPVTITQVGISPTANEPNAAMVNLPGEVKRVSTISGTIAAANVIHLSMLDSSTDVYSMKSFGLYLGDGTLFAVYGQPATIIEKTAASIAALQIDVAFEDIDAASITFGDASFANPPATTEIQGVVELATVAEAQAGADSQRVLTPQAARFALLAWLLSQDGAGSGIDADLLDGQHGAWYADIPARLGFTPLNRAGGSMEGTLGFNLPNFWAGASGGRPTLALDTNDYLAFDRALNRLLIGIGGSEAPVWHGGNDGSGSGLDADLLDGQHASAFAAAADFGYPEVGVYKMPGGFCIQWGSGSHTDNTGIKPVPWRLPMNPFMGFAFNAASAPPAAFHGTGNFTTNGMTVYSARSTSVASPAGTAFNWIGLGVLI